MENSTTATATCCDGSRRFAYDAENRLVTVKDAQNNLTLSIAYDPLGRILETVGLGATTRFVHDGDRLIGEYGGGAYLRRYVHGVGVDEPLVWYQGAARADRRWLHADRQGSIVAYSYLGGTTKYYKYGPYGEVQDWADSRFRYTGQIALPEAELFHYKARVYDPKLGRFLQTDPIGYEDDQNLYAYVGNDPLNRADPAGTQSMSLEAGREIADNQILQRCGNSADCVRSETNNLNQQETKVANAQLTVITGVVAPLAAIARTAGVEAVGAATVTQGESLVGQSFGKLGTVVESQSGNISGFTKHGVDQAITRGVSPSTLLDTVKNPTVVLEQARGKMLYITDQAGVVIGNTGRVITNYGKNNFDYVIKGILSKAK